MEEFIENNAIVTPYILRLQEDKSFCIVAENKVLCADTMDYHMALVALIGVYYMFDISYPPSCYNTYLFIEKYLFEIYSGPPLSGIVGLINTLRCNFILLFLFL